MCGITSPPPPHKTILYANLVCKHLLYVLLYCELLSLFAPFYVCVPELAVQITFYLSVLFSWVKTISCSPTVWGDLATAVPTGEHSGP